MERWRAFDDVRLILDNWLSCGLRQYEAAAAHKDLCALLTLAPQNPMNLVHVHGMQRHGMVPLVNAIPHRVARF